MRRLLGGLLGLVLALALTLIAPVAAQASSNGFSVSGGRIYDANGSLFVPQGINHPLQWYPTQTGAFADARAAGANTIRVVLSGGRYGTSSAAMVADAIARCKANKLVCILEDHDTTGYGEDSSAYTLAQAAQFWVSLRSTLVGQEKYVMINIGNEPFGNSGYANWKSATISAVQTLRAAGLTHTLIVDAPNWGQDWTFTMRDNAAAVAAVDGNTVFSVHMYGIFSTASAVKSYIDSFTSRGLPLLVGEFANYHASGVPDASTILSYTRSQGIGMLAWSWSGNSGEDVPLDLVNGFNPGSLTSWGQRFLNGADGLTARAPQLATVYTTSGSGSSTAPNGYRYCTSASSDPDGDGWGWENSASCVVHGGAADH
ncbi:cellulase family glycosylhydrolase [Microbacterium sp. 22303]|uniref:cellulase family glycosylhydrolase n=1 Tax=Microbacterium sp. 22303 TaxID=3453905 RepID=UPI003F84937A